MNDDIAGRLPQSPAEVIDRSKPVTIQYNGKTVPAFTGDTIASALYAAGVRIMSTSFKYHRPRGIFDIGVHAAEPAMEVDGRLNTRIARIPVGDGMEVRRQSNPKVDIFKLADKASGAMEVGFYYKSFHQSKTVWNKSLEVMRKAPGNLGEVKPLSQKYRFEAVNLTPEILVIGGGAAGIEAALLGASAGVRVVLVEAEAWLGGFFAFQKEGTPVSVKSSADQVRGAGNVTVLTSTVATAIYPEGIVLCTQTCRPDEPFLERLYLIRPKTVVAATGAMDRPLLFNHNDRPGVMLPQTAQRLMHLYGVRLGDTAVAAGGDDSIYQAALDMASSGIMVSAVCDSRRDRAPETLLGQLKKLRIEVLQGWTLSQAEGKQTVTGANVFEMGGSGAKIIKSDLIVASCGRTPLFKILALTGCRIVYRPELGFHLPEELPPGFYAAGRMLGTEYLPAIRAQGRLAAAQALSHLGYRMQPEVDDAMSVLSNPPAVAPNPRQTPSLDRKKDRRFICMGNDVTEKDIDTAIAEGFDSTEMIKRYTTATMGSEQGAVSQANFLDYLAGRKPESLGAQTLFTPRPPIVGIGLGVLAAGFHDHPRRPPLHPIQLAQGGVPIRTGPWIRIEHFGDPEGESLAVHHTAGMCDVSTLGKFRIAGPDAHKLLNCINTRNVDRLSKNRIHYSVACNEEGVIIDDGIIIRRGENDFYITTTTARGSVAKEWYMRWSREYAWDVRMIDLTDAKAGINLAGPRSREILSTLTDTDLSNTALPYMHWIETELAGVKSLLLRMGFMGELSYEIHCSSGDAPYLWQELLSSGKSFGLKTVGLESILLCRLEKGHALPGMDMDGNTSLFEGRYDWCRDKDRHDMVGGPMLKLLQNQPLKNAVVGFECDGRKELTDGDLVVEGKTRLGYATSVRYSPALDKTIGLALVKADPDFKAGTHIHLQHEKKVIPAKVAQPPFYDPKGERMKI